MNERVFQVLQVMHNSWFPAFVWRSDIFYFGAFFADFGAKPPWRQQLPQLVLWSPLGAVRSWKNLAKKWKHVSLDIFWKKIFFTQNQVIFFAEILSLPRQISETYLTFCQIHWGWSLPKFFFSLGHPTPRFTNKGNSYHSSYSGNDLKHPKMQ